MIKTIIRGAALERALERQQEWFERFRAAPWPSGPLPGGTGETITVIATSDDERKRQAKIADVLLVPAPPEPDHPDPDYGF